MAERCWNPLFRNQSYRDVGVASNDVTVVAACLQLEENAEEEVDRRRASDAQNRWLDAGKDRSCGKSASNGDNQIAVQFRPSDHSGLAGDRAMPCCFGGIFVVFRYPAQEDATGHRGVVAGRHSGCHGVYAERIQPSKEWALNRKTSDCVNPDTKPTIRIVQ